MAGQRTKSHRYVPDVSSASFDDDDKQVNAVILSDSKMSFSSRTHDKVFVMELDEGGHAPPRRRFLFWKLTKKQWIGALAAVVLMVLGIVLLIVFLAVVPSIFQSNVDKVKLSINYMDIKSMSSDATSNKMDVELSVRVDADTSTSSTMDEATATLYYQDKPFSAVTLPAQKLTKGENSYDLVMRNEAEITDADVFESLSKALVTDEQVSVDARAEVKAHAMGLSYGGLKLDRSFTIKAFNQFSDPKAAVNNITLSECSGTTYKMLINVTLDNVAQVGLDGIGALNMSVYYQQAYLGQAISTNATVGLPRGPTPMVLELTVVADAAVLPAMKGMITGLISLNAQFYVTGNNPYATSAVLLKDAFAELNMSMPYTDGLKKVTLNPKCNILSLLTASTNSTTTAASTSGSTVAVTAESTTVADLGEVTAA